MKVILQKQGFYEGIQETIVSGLMYGWFDKHVAQRIAKCYGLPRYLILNWDSMETDYFNDHTPHEIDTVFGLESDYPNDED
tara:strand:+ start:1063 stop:1305 length:243 start_codon:yes stop_codon:yes gene_type:complete